MRVADNKASLPLAIGEEIILNEDFHIEVRNADEGYVPVTFEQLLLRKTEEAWPLFAGLDCRIRERKVA
jgi:hypothetical protein